MRTFIENYLQFMKNCIRPPYEKLKPLKSGFIENSNFENNRDPCHLDHFLLNCIVYILVLPIISDCYVRGVLCHKRRPGGKLGLGQSGGVLNDLGAVVELWFDLFHERSL